MVLSMSPEALATMPAMNPPRGVEPNFENPESRAPLAIGLCSFILAIMLLCFAGRLYTKIAITKMFGLDDWLCIIAAINTVAYTASAFAGISTGAAGPHMWNVRFTALDERYFRLLLWGIVQTYGVQLFLRLCIFALILRIFEAHKVAKFLTYVGIAVVCTLYPILFALSLHYCAPTAGQSTMMAIGSAKCQDKGLLITIIVAGASIVLDVYMFMIPQLVVWRLHVSTEKRLRVAVVFALALAATALSAATIYYRIQYKSNPDISWISIPVYICSIWEANLGLICACLPCMPALFNSPGMRNILTLGGRVSYLNVRKLTERSKSDDDAFGANDAISLVVKKKNTTQESFADENAWRLEDRPARGFTKH